MVDYLLSDLPESSFHSDLWKQYRVLCPDLDHRALVARLSVFPHQGVFESYKQGAAEAVGNTEEVEWLKRLSACLASLRENYRVGIANGEKKLTGVSSRTGIRAGIDASLFGGGARARRGDYLMLDFENDSAWGQIGGEKIVFTHVKEESIGSDGTRGRKAGKHSPKGMMIDAFNALCDASSISGKRGDLGRAARLLSSQFHPYREDTIRRYIQHQFKARFP